MIQFQPFLYSSTLDESALAADFGNGPEEANYLVGDEALYRRIALHLPQWRYLPYESVVSAEPGRREFLSGG